MPLSAIPITPVMGQVALPWESEGREPTPEEQLARIENAVSTLNERLHNRTRDLGQRIRSLAEGVADQEWGTLRREQAIRAFLREALTADLGRRKFGASLLLVGVVVATAANLGSLSAC